MLGANYRVILVRYTLDYIDYNCPPTPPTNRDKESSHAERASNASSISSDRVISLTLRYKLGQAFNSEAGDY